MAHRTILTERQRSALFDLPTDETLMLRHYTLADDDIEHINERRRCHTLCRTPANPSAAPARPTPDLRLQDVLWPRRSQPQGLARK